MTSRDRKPAQTRIGSYGYDRSPTMVQQIQVRKLSRRTTELAPDLRTPKGRVLPY
jgi:hypothetical protein